MAIKRGTAKVHEAKNNPAIKIVNPDWLWTCAERWEHVDERLFPLTKEVLACTRIYALFILVAVKAFYRYFNSLCRSLKGKRLEDTATAL